MKLTLEIDQKLLEEAKRLDGSKTTEELLDQALQYYVGFLKRRDILLLKGKVDWQGDLYQMRGGENE